MSNILMNLDEVIGQTSIVKWFKSTIERDRLPQVVMLVGPAGIGKTSIARIVACEIGYMNDKDKLEQAKKAVICNHESTDVVRLYNMSNLKSQEAVAEVKADLSIGFSSTQRKVIIMDEAHGMSDEAQDSLLVAFESLQTHVYVIVCSTEIESFRDAFLSRCLLRRLSNLSMSEMKSLLKKRIAENKLAFTLSNDMIISLIATYTGREPRRAINLLDSFEQGTTVTVDDLESFMNVYEGKQIVTLIDYLYGSSVLLGLSYIKELDLGSTFCDTLLEVLRIGDGGESTILGREATLHLRELLTLKGNKNLMGFVVDCTTCGRLTRNKLSGFFLKWIFKEEIIKTPPMHQTPEQIHVEDLALMQTMLDKKDVNIPGKKRVIGLEELLAGAETVQE